MTIRSSMPVSRGAGGDPWAGARTGSAYNRIAGLHPSSTRGLPAGRSRQCILRDLFRAVELAPHNVEILEGLATVVLNLQPVFESAAKVRDLLERARTIVTTSELSKRDSVERAELRRKIVEILEPDAAIDSTWKQVETILREVQQPRRNGRS